MADGGVPAADPNGGTPPDGAGDEVARQARLPRWTRQEILVLIQGKRVAETRSRRVRGASADGLGQLEPKWASVSSYCRRHGVNRGPVQCRKRWSNLAGDYKKIKEWDGGAGRESFWAMRNDVRRERKLPGFFDREVYDILDRGADERTATEGAPRVDVVISRGEEDAAAGATTAAGREEEEEEERAAVFDSGRAAAAEDGLFSDGEAEETGDVAREASQRAAAAIPISEKQYDPISQTSERLGRASQKQPASRPDIGSSSKDTRKRRRLVAEGEDREEEEPTPDLQGRMVDALERNGRLLTTQLESQNRNLQLDRDQRRIQTDGLLSVLNKLADALGRIADKL
ncbi:hypothetical protein MLD38_009445 [Melastoma candidum]|uniref:Uncharacterized protein n=1 Tax=Melastoma candidum TaxID=119954 RepID=A0ACB9RZ27_9MYRT|nr:hypothetical protein MLD38_009445 [Melastoma candidum]